MKMARIRLFVSMAWVCAYVARVLIVVGLKINGWGNWCVARAEGVGT